MIDAMVDVPSGWLVQDPPPGVALVALEPMQTTAVRANVVVTMVDRPADNDVDRYLDDVLSHLLVDLDDAKLLDAWTTDRAVTDDQLLPGQRFVVHHRVGGTPVSTVQQHTWVDDTIVVVTATTSIDVSDELVDVLCRCLDSVAVGVAGAG